ncbi:hypothetical protein BJ166DRAFT_511006 [Pestalotiopsis sp. NC0098]|nr:hypothetical protein BJ166DRAFT_511006 [Pestalotiopsis sp. NC0098]
MMSLGDIAAVLDVPYLQSALLLTLIIVLALWKRHQSKATSEDAPVNVPWQYPEPSPDLSFDLEKREPPRFRAFRYHYKRHVLDVRKLDKDSWVMLDKDWPMYHQMKVERLADRGEKAVQTLPEAREAAWELCQDLCEFLSRVYPQVYRIRRSGRDNKGWYGSGSIVSVEMPSLGASYDLMKDDSLTVAGLIQPADLNILMIGDDGQYRLVAMMLGIGGGQRIKDKLGNSLADLHFSGHVPHYAERLQKPLDRFLSKLQVEAPFHRNTTGISTHDAFHWPTATMGPEDDWDPIIQGPGVGTPSHGKWKPQGPITDISQLWFRQERQVLRRLPKSRAIVWCVHTYIEPMDTVAREPGIPGRLASLVRSWDPVMAKYFLTFCLLFLTS